MDKKKKKTRKEDEPVKVVPTIIDDADEEFEEDFLIFELTEDEEDE